MPITLLQAPLIHLSRWAGIVMFCAGTSMALGQAASADIGQVTLVVGLAHQTIDGITKPVRRGDSINVGAKLQTSENGHVHLRFIDGALVSLRPSSALRVTQYQFSKDQPSASKVKFELEEGTARAITGAAGKAARESFRLNTPVAALGVRGTDFSVFSSRSESLVSVNSGAVVVSQFGEGCARAGSGPCPGANSLELRASGTIGASGFITAAAERPVIVSENVLRLAVAAAPSAATQRADAAANNFAGLPTAAAVSEVASSAAAGKVLNDEKSFSLTTTNDGASKLAWGRWHATAWAGDTALPYLDAAKDRQVTVGNASVSLFRTPQAAFELPSWGSARMALQSGQVHLVDRFTQEPGQINSGALIINFVDKRFSTELRGLHPSVGDFVVQASGALSTTASVPGVFVSDSSTTGARVAGALTSNASEAGYFFEQPASRSTLMGTTNWRR